MKRQAERFCAMLLSAVTMLSSLSFVTALAKEDDSDITAPTLQSGESIAREHATGDLTKNTNSNPDKVIRNVVEYYKELGKSLPDKGAKAPLPSSVDNSNSPYFPPIGNQRSIGSCGAWAGVYYQFTYSYNKAHNRIATASNSFSPKWIYNKVNGGEDGGSYHSEVFDAMKQQGNVTLEQVPYDTDYLDWSPSKELWSSASDYRLESYQVLDMGNLDTPVTSPTDPDLDLLKTALANGDVLTYSTYIYSWNFGNIAHNNAVPENDNYLNDYIACKQMGYSGSHRMTIVGYNDNIWYDINGNGIVDNGEMGAFKVANSWGNVYNQGFVWICYDALNNVSSVSGVVDGSSRNGIFREIARIDVKQYDSDSDIVLNYTVNSDMRNQTRFTVIAERDGTKYSKTVNPYDFSYQGSSVNSFAYDGTTVAKDAAMTFDLDNVIEGLTSDELGLYSW